MTGHSRWERKHKNKDAYNGEAAVMAAPYPSPAQDVHNVTVTVLSSHGATVAKTAYASVYNTGIPVSATGSAKREPGDDYDRETGRLLATSRALEILAGKLRRKANSRIRNAEAIKVHRAQVRMKRTGSGQVKSPEPQDVTWATVPAKDKKRS
jgi:hypothetical protein